jgi:hypothetical protein
MQELKYLSYTPIKIQFQQIQLKGPMCKIYELRTCLFLLELPLTPEISQQVAEAQKI